MADENAPLIPSEDNDISQLLLPDGSEWKSNISRVDSAVKGAVRRAIDHSVRDEVESRTVDRLPNFTLDNDFISAKLPSKLPDGDEGTNP